MKELEFVEIIKNTLSNSSFIGDDTAFWQGLALTQDTLVQDVHFRLATTTPYELGQKAIAVNLSDLAAAGAEPACVLISLSLPKDINSDFVKEFYKGVDLLCTQYGAKVLGGDITGGDKISITVTAIGKASKKIQRSSAKVDDVVFVTGEHGNSRAGLEILEKNLAPVEKFLKAHKTPAPRIKEGQKIAEVAQNPAIMDTSDGLADALFKVASSSKVTIEVEFAKIPYDKNLAKENWIFFGGEDFELLACATREEFEKIKSEIEVFEIGKVTKLQDAPVVIKKGQKTFKMDKTVIENLSFDHFKGENQ